MTDPNGRLTEQPDVIRFCQQRNLPAVVVGRWVWVYFEHKPSAELRHQIKTAGFSWVKNRQGWAHNCGYYSKQGHGDPRWKYGSVPVTNYTDADIAHLETI